MYGRWQKHFAALTINVDLWLISVDKRGFSNVFRIITVYALTIYILFFVVIIVERKSTRMTEHARDDEPNLREERATPPRRIRHRWVKKNGFSLLIRGYYFSFHSYLIFRDSSLVFFFMSCISFSIGN